MIHLTTPQIAGLIAWLATTIVILALAAKDRRRQKRIERLLDNLYLPARDAATRYQWSRGPRTTSDERAALDHAMEILAQAVQKLDQEKEAAQ